MRSGDIGDEAGRSAGDAGPLDLDAVRADDDLIDALAAGLVPPPCGPSDPSDVEGRLVALLAGWVADVRPETLLHPVPASTGAWMLDAAENAESENAESGSVENTTDDSDEDAKRFIDVCSELSGEPQPLSLLEHNEVARPVRSAPWRSAAARPYLLRAAAWLVAVAVIGSGVVAQSYDAHPGEPLWVIAKMVFPAKSHSVEAASTVSTALNTARVALESGRIDEAREAFQTVAAQLGDVDPADGRVELDHQMDYLSAQLSAPPETTGTATEIATSNAADQPLAMGSAGAVIPSGPAVTPGATTALATSSTRPAPAVHSAPPYVTSAGSPTPADASSPPPPDAVLAAPSPSVGGSADLPPAPPASAPAVNSAPHATDPVASAPATTDPPASTQNFDPTTAPPRQSETSGPAVDPGTNNPGTNGPDTHDPAADNPGVTSPDNSDTNHTDNSNASNNNASNNNADSDNKNTDSTQGNSGSKDSAAAQSPASNRSADAAAPLDVSVDGVAGSSLGEVTGVVTDTAVS